MRIRVMTVCKNEERIMSFFIRHYEPWVDEIVIIDGGSTDKSIEIATTLGNKKVKTWRAEYDDGKYINDLILRRIRNEEWKNGMENFDWMIVCDNDEFLYHPNILEKLKEYKEQGITLPLVEGYQMISKKFPNTELKITDQVRRGHLHTLYSKNIIFDCKRIFHMNYGAGSHSCRPEGEVVKSEKAELKLLHYRMLGHEYHLDKANITAKNLEPNLLKKLKFGIHNIGVIDKCTPEVFKRKYKSSIKVI